MSQRYDITWLSPSTIKTILACAKMAATKSFHLGKIGEAGGLRHLALEIHLNSILSGQRIPLPAAAEMAAEEYKGKMAPADIAKAVSQVSQTLEAGLPDADTILSIEGSNLPEELMQKASSHPDAEPMLHVVIRDKAGDWGPPYGVRMKIDVLHLLDPGGETDDLQVTDFKGFQPSYEPGDNDIQALCNFVGVVAIARSMGLKPAKFKWVGLAIPSLREDAHEFWVAGYDDAVKVLDQVNATWAKLKDDPTETAGKHCGNCKLNTTARCSAWKDADKPVVVKGHWDGGPTKIESADGVERWGDEFLMSVFDALKARAGQIESLIALVKPELTKRSKQRVIGPPGFKYTSRQQGTASIEWSTTKLLDLCEKWGVDPAPFLGITGGKKLIESIVSASTNDKLERKNRLEQLKDTFTQGTTYVLKLVPLASTETAGVTAKETPEPKALPLEEQRAAGVPV